MQLSPAVNRVPDECTGSGYGACRVLDLADHDWLHVDSGYHAGRSVAQLRAGPRLPGLPDAGHYGSDDPDGTRSECRPDHESVSLFWQWVGGAATSSTAHPTTATVYSDNHGEAVVSLETGLTSGTLQTAPVNGVCPSGYYLVTATTTTAANCILNLAQLGLTTGAPFGTFQNVAKVTGGVLPLRSPLAPAASIPP